MREWLAGIILPFADTMFTLVRAIPLGFVKALFFGILAALAIWAILMPAQLPESSRGKYSFFKDLRVFAVAVLVLQALLYIIF